VVRPEVRLRRIDEALLAKDNLIVIADLSREDVAFGRAQGEDHSSLCH
jgi:hypothetical protein